MRICVAVIDVGNASEADILRCTTHEFARNRLTVLPDAADICGIAECMLTGTAAAHIFVVLNAAETTGQIDCRTVQLRTKLFEFFYQFMWLPSQLPSLVTAAQSARLPS